MIRDKISTKYSEQYFQFVNYSKHNKNRENWHYTSPILSLIQDFKTDFKSVNIFKTLYFHALII